MSMATSDKTIPVSAGALASEALRSHAAGGCPSNLESHFHEPLKSLRTQGGIEQLQRAKAAESGAANWDQQAVDFEFSCMAFVQL